MRLHTPATVAAILLAGLCFFLNRTPGGPSELHGRSLRPDPTAETSPSESHGLAGVGLVEGRRTAGATDEAASEGLTFELEVFSTEDQEGIAGATVASIARRPDAHPARADARGRVAVTLGSAPDWPVEELLVEAPGHSRRLVTVDTAAPPARIGLMPAGSVALTVVDDLGQPAAGIELQLIPPGHGAEPWLADWRSIRSSRFRPSPEDIRERARGVASPELAHWTPGQGLVDANPEAPLGTFQLTMQREASEVFRHCIPWQDWVQTTDESGRVEWRGLPAVDGYQWGSSVVSLVELEPEPVPARLAVPGQPIQVSSEEPDRSISGPFTVIARERVEFTGTVVRQTGVMGYFWSARPVPPSRVVVKVFHRSPEADEIRQRYVSLEIERNTWADEDGLFVCEGIRPGRAVLRGFWKEEGERFFFATRPFVAQKGEVEDLGEITASQGSALPLRIVIVDSEGEELDPSSVFSLDSEPVVWLNITAVGLGGSPYPPISAQVQARLGHTTELMGLPNGRCVLSVDLVEEGSQLLDPHARLILPPSQTVLIPSYEEPTLVLEYVPQVRQVIEARFPSALAAVRAEAHLISTKNSRTYKRDLRPERSREGVVRGELSVPPGEYHLLVHTQAAEERDEATSLFYSGRVTVPDGAAPTLVLDLEAGATVEGLAEDREGGVHANAVILCSTGPFRGVRKQTWTHQLETDEEGRFQIRGLPPGSSFITNHGTFFRSGPAGSTEEVRWRW